MNNLNKIEELVNKRPRFHVSPHDKKIRPCEAKEGECRFINESEHFFSQEEVDNYLKGSNPAISTLKKGEQPPDQTLILSDVDGTLVKGSLVLQHAVDLHESGFIDLGRLPNFWVNDKKNEDLVTSLADAYRMSLIGKRVDGLMVNRTLNKLLHNEDNHYSVMKRLIKSGEDGARVILISGSPDYLINPFANRFNFESTSTKYHTDKNGSLTGEIDLMATADAKEGFIKTLDVGKYDDVVAVGDTASDFPLFEVADRAILVEPTDETISKVIESKKQIEEIVYH